MKFINGLKSLNKTDQSCVATIGNFDGLHLGHQKIISCLKEQADVLNLPLTVISFEPLPAEYFMSEPPARVYPLRDKIKRMSSLGVDNFLCLKFNDLLANTPPRDFVKEILIDSLKVKFLMVGDDFRFGYKREGDFALLKEMGQQFGMQVEDTKTQLQDGERISSTRIRAALKKGDIKVANALLNHPYQLSGRIRQGDKLGRTIGFPTVNMTLVENIAIRKGVYAVRVHGLSEKAINGVANIGTRPTVSGMENRLETHLFDFSADVYNEYISVELLDFIREEKNFKHFEQLKEQIALDVVKAKNIFRRLTD